MKTWIKFIIPLIALLYANPSFPQTIGDGSNVVSSVATRDDKEVMLVDGKPFFYNAIQTSFPRLPGWNWSQLGAIFNIAKDDGFTVIGIIARWSDIEPEMGHFVWNDLDSALTCCAKSGMKMEILWFGSDVCTKLEGAPGYVKKNYQAVLKADGAELINNADGLRKLDKTDTTLLAREMFVITTMMNHIRSFLDSKSYPNVVVGIQVLNEASVLMFEIDHSVYTDRSYSSFANKKWQNGGFKDANTFNADIMWEYLNGCARAVKTSNYSVWTRHNWCPVEENLMWLIINKNERQKLRGASYLDFIGFDTYKWSKDSIYHYGKLYHLGHNLPMIMENSGDDSTAAQNIFNAYAGNALYHIWEIHDPGGLYGVNREEKRLMPKTHTESVRQLNLMLKKNWYSLATKAADSDSLKFLNRYYDSKVVMNFDSVVNIVSHPVRYQTTNGGVAIISARNNSLYFQSTTTATISVPSSLPVLSLENGYYDPENNWVSLGPIDSKINGDSRTFLIPAYGCVRLKTKPEHKP